METHHRPLHFEHLSSQKDVQNGDSQVNLLPASQGSVDLLHRPHGRLFSYPHSSNLQEVPEDLLRGEGLSVQSSALWHLNSPMALHKGSILNKAGHRPKSSSTFPVHRRLAGGVHEKESLLEPDQGSAQPLSDLRSPGKPGKVGSCAYPTVQFHRHLFRSGSGDDSSHKREHSEAHRSCDSLPDFDIMVRTAVAESHRDFRCAGQVCSLGQVQAQANSGLFPVPVETLSREPVRYGPAASTSSSTLAVVDQSPEFVARCSSRSSPVPVQTVHRCFNCGLGSSSGQSSCSRCLVRGGEDLTYQQTRDEGHTSGSHQFQDSSGGQDSCRHRQLYCCMLCKQRRRYEVPISVAGDHSPTRPSYHVQMDPQGEAHTGSPECSGRPAQSSWSGDSHRVVPTSTSGGVGLSTAVETHGRSFCHKIQQQTSHICVSSARSRGTGDRCHFHELGGVGCVCIPPSSDSQQSVREVQVDRDVQYHSDCTILGEPELVPRALETVEDSTPSTSCKEKPTEATSDKRFSFGPRVSKVKRLAASKKALKKSGFSKRVRDRVVAPQKASTRRMYLSRWNNFCSWCKMENIEPEEATVPQIADFLLFVFEELVLTPKTVEGYRTAISSSLKFVSEVDIGRDQRLTALIHSFYQERPNSMRTHPPWDLSVVLGVLSSSLFEPIDDANRVSLQLLTWKTAFLVLLASGCRRGEIHALKKEILKDPKWKWVTLYPLASFVSKTQLRTSGATALQSVRLEALSTILPPDQARDRALCPVRALKAYLSRTRHMREGKKLLFISCLEGHTQDIHPNTISGWIRKLIQFCYQNADSHTARLQGTSTHAIRGLAATLAFRGSVSMENILKSCSWKSHNTFTSHYLKDITGVMEGLLRLGPLVVAQAVVNPQ